MLWKTVMIVVASLNDEEKGWKKSMNVSNGTRCERTTRATLAAIRSVAARVRNVAKSK